MNYKKIIMIVENYVKDISLNESTGHDWWHIKRVFDLALKINEKENGNEFIVGMIALLHDVFDDKFSDVLPSIGIPQLLKRLNVYDYVETKDFHNILFSIENLGFKGGFNTTHLSIEGSIVQDADRIDAIGAIGIARCFAYNGKKGNVIYDPDIGIFDIQNEDEYRNMKRHAINHFYEKLLKLHTTINTCSAKEIALQRTKFMELYLEEFFSEWKGNK